MHATVWQFDENHGGAGNTGAELVPEHPPGRTIEWRKCGQWHVLCPQMAMWCMQIDLMARASVVEMDAAVPVSGAGAVVVKATGAAQQGYACAAEAPRPFAGTGSTKSLQGSDGVVCVATDGACSRRVGASGGVWLATDTGDAGGGFLRSMAPYWRARTVFARLSDPHRCLNISQLRCGFGSNPCYIFGYSVACDL